MNPIRIAYVIDTIDSPTGGTERQLLALLRGLDRRTFSPQLVCLHGSDWLAGQSLDFPVTICGIRSLMRPATVAALFQFRRLCLETPFDIIQTFFVDANLFGTLGAALSRRPVLVSSRRNIGHWHDRAQVALLRGLRRWTHYYLANSRAVAEHTRAVEHVAPDRIEVIHNGIEFEDRHPPPSNVRVRQREAWGVGEDDLLVGCVANLREVKNLPEFLTASAIAVGMQPRLRFVIVGEGPDRAALEARIQELRLAQQFHLAGQVMDIRPALAAFDIAVQCSRAESSSNSLLEYLATGLPVVASNIPGNVEVVEQEKTGLLYEVGNPRALASALTRLAGDEGLRGRLGEAGYEMAHDRYTMARCLQEHAAFYRRIVEGHLAR
jgi:glycosyltransferase involved in cell wall biosynthesis